MQQTLAARSTTINPPRRSAATTMIMQFDDENQTDRISGRPHLYRAVKWADQVLPGMATFAEKWVLI
jgi:hypothetical protein